MSQTRFELTDEGDLMIGGELLAGFDQMQMWVSDSMVPAVCVNVACEEFAELGDNVELDARDYNCPCCKQQTYKSVLVVAGLV